MDNSDAPSLKQPDRLRFDSQDDALNFARDLVQRSSDFLAAQSLNVVKCYVHGQCNIAVELRSMRDSEVFQLVFSSIPAISDELNPISTNENTIADLKIGSSPVLDRSNDGSVRVGVPYLVQTKHQPIYSLVRAECYKERVDFRRNALESGTSFELTLNGSGSITDRKCRVLRVAAVEGEGAGVNSVIQGVSEIGGGILDDGVQSSGRLPSDTDLVNILSSLRIVLNDAGVCLTFVEPYDFRYHVANVLICTADK